MNSVSSEENKSSSGTSESERNQINQKIKSFQYPPMPKRDYELRSMKNQKINLITNLFEIKLIDENHRFALFNVEILPEISFDNYTLRRQVYASATLPKSFKKFFWAGNNLYILMNGEKDNNSTDKDIEEIEISEEVNKVNYKIKLKKIKEIIFKNINDFNGENQQIKSIIENLFRSILLNNPNVIKFHDRTIFEINPKNIHDFTQSGNKIYKGYITSAHITENGLFMQINNRNKFISGKTVFQKMLEIKQKFSHSSTKEVNDAISDYFFSHRTVLTTYGSIKTYKVKEVNFSRTPNNTDITMKDNNGIRKTISIINYYNFQYGIDIKEKNQPLLIVENNNSKSRKSNGKKNASSNEDNCVIYLIPELVYITGLEDDDNHNNKVNNRRNIIDKTKMDPAEKMSTINSINDLINSDTHKKIKRRNGQEIIKKSPKELIEEWGINIGNNLCFQGRVIPQPKLYFKEESFKTREDGRFRSRNPFLSDKITNDNIFFVYDLNEKNIDQRNLFVEIMKKCRSKDFQFSNDFNPSKVKGYGLENTSNWESIYKTLIKINISDKNSLGIIFCSWKMEKYYYKLKTFFSQQYNIPTQHVLTKNLLNQKRTDSIQFNIVDQINVKRGGMNFYIDFINEGIINNEEVFLIIGLDSKTSNKKITFSMTSTINAKLNKFITQEKKCDLSKQERNETLKRMFEIAIDGINKNSPPHSPDFIIIYRQGGNDFFNKKLAINELDNFKEVLEKYREKYKNNNKFNFDKTKLYYICCNLKSDLKFFETNDNNVATAYFNPKSGLVVDNNVVQKDKFEFYIQPQFVTEGCATPCHYQVMYYEKSENNDFSIEKLEKLSFYLSFYYWTWSGAIRIPSLLKMSTTALQFYEKIFDNRLSHLFPNPTYI